MKAKLDKIDNFLREFGGTQKSYVDTGPILDAIMLLSRRRLARQKHDVDQYATGDLVFSRRNLDDARIAARSSTARSLRNVRTLHHSLSHWCNYRSASVGCAALYFVSNH
jgi:hypothetical protein